ncbi:hypothetical protein FZEAL_4609 [Fusarium zealandicum]|uniref:Transcription activator GCR1-like domain-containing protein n=1 Tax=Fusarium zealandicum TaxID=1053134 RepID=A0A8H4UMB2_9HYPO|nr:hypothetical protein FZEAL_4609 [Fusarium zealandicum]
MPPSPNRSPDPFVVGLSASKGPPHRSAPNPGLQTAELTPRHQSPEPLQDDRPIQNTSESDSESWIGDSADQVPLNLARTIVNMQEYYVGELEAEKRKTEQLLAQNSSMSQKMEAIENRLQMHVVLMDGFVSFMKDVKEGKFAVGAKTTWAEMKIAEQLGHEHIEAVQALDSNGLSGKKLVQHEMALSRPEESVRHYPDGKLAQPVGTLSCKDEAPFTTRSQREDSIYPKANQFITPEDDFDELPPTPCMHAAPVRSSGQRAPKRRNPFMRERRKARLRKRACTDDYVAPSRRPRLHLQNETGKTNSSDRHVTRQNRVDEDSMSDSDMSEPADMSGGNLSTARAWTPVNIHRDDDAPPVSTTDSTLERNPPVSEPSEEDDDLEYSPISDEDEQEPPSVPSRSSTTEWPDPLSTKPRYSVPRSVGYRYATGPPGQRFKYHRMPKTVALVWNEVKLGSHGNPAIEELECKYGIAWRLGTSQERKYASNYVGVRQKIVRKVEEMCGEDGISVKEACRRLDERVDGRMQLLMTALRKGEDPLKVIPKRG